MNPDLDRIANTLNGLWETYAPVLLAAAVAAASVALWLGLRYASRGLRALIRVQDIKLRIGFAAVQAGVTLAVVTGVFEAATRIFNAGLVEALIIAVFAEASVWVAVGRIRAYSLANPDAGMGLAGRLFWVATIGGGALAVIGSTGPATAAGRVIIVALGTALWWERIREWVPATGKRSQWRWTPKRLLLALGAMAPEDGDIEDEAREWQIRRLARAMRWANSRWPLCSLGGRALARRAETTTEDVLAEARRRFAAAWIMREQARVDSETMAAVIDEATDAAKWAATRTANWPDLAGVVSGQEPAEPSASGRGMAGQHGGQSARPTAADASGQKWTAKRRRNAEKAAAILARQPDISGAELAKRLKLSPRSGQRARHDAAILSGATPAEVAATDDRPAGNGHADIDPATVADMTTGADRT